MHRSGTSLAAALLQSSGAHMGDRLMEANWSNPRGHFEDMDFVDVHVAALEKLGLNRDGWDLKEVEAFPDELVDHAHWLVGRNRSRGRPWGWKDPRGTLFVRLWCKMVPDAKAVVVFREPWKVVDSLYKRGDKVFAHDPELAVRAWVFYNRCLLRLAADFPDRCLVANVDDIAADPAGWIEAIRTRTATPLRDPDPTVPEPLLLHGAIARGGAGIIQRHFPQALELYASLQAVAWQPAASAAHRGHVEPGPENGKGAMAEWQEARAVYLRCREVEGELGKALEAIHRAREMLAAPPSTDEGSR